jgi:uncharacterized protein (DUF4415 family)
MRLRKVRTKTNPTAATVSGSEGVRVRIPLDEEVRDHFKQQGRDWQKRINDTLRRAIERERKRAKA